MLGRGSVWAVTPRQGGKVFWGHGWGEEGMLPELADLQLGSHSSPSDQPGQVWADAKPGQLLGKHLHLSPCFLQPSKPFCLSSLAGETGDTAPSLPDVGIWCHHDRHTPSFMAMTQPLPSPGLSQHRAHPLLALPYWLFVKTKSRGQGLETACPGDNGKGRERTAPSSRCVIFSAKNSSEATNPELAQAYKCSQRFCPSSRQG